MATSRHRQRLQRKNLLLPRGSSSMAPVEADRGAPGGPHRAGRDSGVRHHSWYTYGDDSRACTRGMATEPKFELGKGQGAPRPRSNSWTNRPSIPGSSRRAGRATPWKSARWPYVIGYMQNKPEFKEPVKPCWKSWTPGGSAVLHPGPHRRPWPGKRVGRHKMRRNYDELIANIKAGDTATANIEKWEPASWPKRKSRAWALPRRRAQLAGPLAENRQHPHRQLPVHRAHHLERRPARQQRPIGALRGQPDEHPAGQAGRAAGNPAHLQL